MEAAVLDAIERQVTAACRHLGKSFPALAEDISQEAWLAALSAAPRYQPQHPGARGYFYRVATLRVSSQVRRWRSAASLTKRAAAEQQDSAEKHDVSLDFVPERGLSAHGGFGSGEDNNRWMFLAAAVRATQEDHLLVVDRATEILAWRVRWRRAVEKVLARRSDLQREVGSRILGLDYRQMSVAEAAVELGIWKSQAENAARRVRGAISRNPEAVRAEQKLKELEGDQE